MTLRRAPDFWWKPERTLAARGLAPLGAIYGAVTARRMGRAGRTLDVPVLCVGNFVAGGAGKTPVVMAAAERLRAMGHLPAVLSRGYGRETVAPGVVRVDPDRHLAAEVGDEPLLLARVAPTFVGTDRVASGQAAIAAGARVLVLDDGMQNPALRKDATIAVLDGATGVGNGACVPAGPLRAPLARQWPAVSLLCVLGSGAPGDALLAEASGRGVPALRAEIVPDARSLARLRGLRLFAFAGIGRPEKFFETLVDSGLEVVGRRGYPDHHAYDDADRRGLEAAARALGAALVTTAKDRVRLPARFPVAVLAVAPTFDDPGALDRLLTRLMGAPAGRS